MTATLDLPLVNGLYVTARRPDGHCSNGHPMTIDNIMIKKSGSPRCRACTRSVTRRSRRQSTLRGLAPRPIPRPAPVPYNAAAELAAETVEAFEHRPRTGSWCNDAACRDSEPDLFEEASDEESRRSGGRPARLPRVREALSICGRCPVRSQCDATAMSQTDVAPSGVVGGRYYSAKTGAAQLRRARAVGGVS
ncbi:WhiB family transcriptional regulator [Actinoalloteichus sp. GBA129-24]|uniref:WhiB family transcriptional regulator n=1 Tax=Actinoalloteichus sp. GBA129-24 TaxID=1612551 RepID=UPI000950AE1C|nr:WhiB family transcriptional regulator [Actinoalloteichus sp. GBA129-24]APU20889.1 Transcription factor WhiB [Actinoalloteichus sp. GBA129-24]APU24138.1 Transcription factor WhiB [Actinoalloteichus sp. GBA129-24]